MGLGLFLDIAVHADGLQIAMIVCATASKRNLMIDAGRPVPTIDAEPAFQVKNRFSRALPLSAPIESAEISPALSAFMGLAVNAIYRHGPEHDDLLPAAATARDVAIGPGTVRTADRFKTSTVIHRGS